jgi:repressor LexA
MGLGQIVKTYLDEHGLSLQQFGDKCGMSKAYVSMLIRGKNPTTGKPVSPTIDTYRAIAPAMGMSLMELVQIAEEDTPTIFHIIAPKDSDVEALETKRIPIIGDTAAGEPIVANREYDEYIEVPIDGRRYDAAVRVRGDSMEPGYRIGDLALIRYQDDVEDGQIAVVCLDDEVTLKRIHHMENGVMLISDNPKYAPKIITTEEVPNIHLTGRAIGVIRWEE